MVEFHGGRLATTIGPEPLRSFLSHATWWNSMVEDLPRLLDSSHFGHVFDPMVEDWQRMLDSSHFGHLLARHMMELHDGRLATAIGLEPPDCLPRRQLKVGVGGLACSCALLHLSSCSLSMSQTD
eukprot:gnl/TRDRNA2_/TRDRNA2_151236_c1_seq1.p1 gnl/TRDRNA2_/TRDRNA2_151236_c1~~gnl/TRDRNA2_/TRDRNA2_151236_c1_seq1.p1  ORF type:complete len:125 (+),score=6.70 gnl/TRDRNA2_/TRDRNA2_151236_c1_seq1:80-454(+)